MHSLHALMHFIERLVEGDRWAWIFLVILTVFAVLVGLAESQKNKKASASDAAKENEFSGVAEPHPPLDVP